jgi:hypothetical protein
MKQDPNKATSQNIENINENLTLLINQISNLKTSKQNLINRDR